MLLTQEQYANGCKCPKIPWLEWHRPELASATDGKNAANREAAVRDLAISLESPPATADVIVAHDGCMASVDLLYEEPDGVRFTNLQECNFKTEHDFQRAAFQLVVMENSGMTVQQVNLMEFHDYRIYHAGQDLKDLFSIEEITKQVREQAEAVPERINELKAVCNVSEEPDTAIGPHCLEPLPCPFKAWCWQHMPRWNVYDIVRLEPYEAYKLQQEGIISFAEAAEAIVADKIYLKPRQVDQVLSRVRWHRPIIKPWDLQLFLDQLSYPLYLLQFDTAESPFPPYDGMSACDPLPIGYSLRWQNAPDEDWHETAFQAEYEVEPTEDPRPTVAKQLQTDLPEDACLMVYDHFATSDIFLTFRIGTSGWDKLKPLIQREWPDLMAPFRQGAYYTKEMDGSAELERVYAAMFPDEEVPKNASATWRTLAMTRILAKIRTLAEEWVS